MSIDVKETRGKLQERRDRLHRITSQANAGDGVLDLTKADDLSGTAADRLHQLRALNDEVDALASSLEPHDQAQAEVTRSAQIADRLGERATGVTFPGQPGRGTAAPKHTSLGAAFLASEGYTNRRGNEGPTAELDIDLGATLFETGAGWAPETTRQGVVVPYATRPPQITDVVPQGTTTQAAYLYMEETTFTNNAAEAAEAAQYGEAVLALTERSKSVRKIAVFLPATDEQLEDVDGARAYIDNRLPTMLRQRLDGQLWSGDDNAPNLCGFTNVSGIQTQAKSTDTVPDAIYKAMVKCRITGRSTPGAAIVHPTDWQGVRLLKTADGIYIWGNPSEAGPARIWGIPVIESDAGSAGTALVGDFATHSTLFIRRGIEMKVSDSHSDYFIKGKQAIRADMRAVLVVFRPAAFVTVTGL